jgi:hypothetical protein
VRDRESFTLDLDATMNHVIWSLGDGDVSWRCAGMQYEQVPDAVRQDEDVRAAIAAIHRRQAERVRALHAEMMEESARRTNERAAMRVRHAKEWATVTDAYRAYEHFYKAASVLDSKIRLLAGIAGVQIEYVLGEWGLPTDLLARLAPPSPPPRSARRRGRPPSAHPPWESVYFPYLVEGVLSAAQEAGGRLVFLRSDPKQQTLEKALRLLAPYLPHGFASREQTRPRRLEAIYLGWARQRRHRID